MAPGLPLSRLLWRSLAGVAVGGVLAGVFIAYLNPHTVVDLANRLWSCF